MPFRKRKAVTSNQILSQVLAKIVLFLPLPYFQTIKEHIRMLDKRRDLFDSHSKGNYDVDGSLFATATGALFQLQNKKSFFNVYFICIVGINRFYGSYTYLNSIFIDSWIMTADLLLEE